MRNIIKHPFINLIFFVALFAFSGCTNEMEPDIAGNSNLPADGTPLTVRATASGFQAPAQPGGSPATRTPVMEATSTKFQTGDANVSIVDTVVVVISKQTGEHLIDNYFIFVIHIE